MQQQAKAFTKYVRISPQKARLAANLVRGLPVQEALSQLLYCNLKAGRLLKKTLESAMANAEYLYEDYAPAHWGVVEIRVDEGPTLKRAKSRSRGRRNPILKRSSHFTIRIGNMGEGK